MAVGAAGRPVGEHKNRVGDVRTAKEEYTKRIHGAIQVVGWFDSAVLRSNLG